MYHENEITNKRADTMQPGDLMVCCNDEYEVVKVDRHWDTGTEVRVRLFFSDTSTLTVKHGVQLPTVTRSELPDNLDDLEVGCYLAPREDLGQLEAHELWVCSYCEHLAGGGEEDETWPDEADLFFQKYAAPDYSITLVGETRAGENSEVTGVCDVCSSADGLREIELARMAAN